MVAATSDFLKSFDLLRLYQTKEFQNKVLGDLRIPIFASNDPVRASARYHRAVAEFRRFSTLFRSATLETSFSKNHYICRKGPFLFSFPNITELKSRLGFTFWVACAILRQARRHFNHSFS